MDAGGVEVVDDLGLMFGLDCFDGFEFDKNFVFYEKIGVEGADVLAAKDDLNLFLSFDRQKYLKQGNLECFFVNRFKKTAAKLIDHFEGTADDRFRMCFKLELLIL